MHTRKLRLWEVTGRVQVAQSIFTTPSVRRGSADVSPGLCDAKVDVLPGHQRKGNIRKAGKERAADINRNCT